MLANQSESVAIKWRLANLMLEKDVKTGRLAEVTQLHPGTISKLKKCREMPKRLDSDTLNKLCTALHCQPGDLLVWVPDDNDNQEAVAISDLLLKPKLDALHKGSADSKSRKRTRSLKAHIPQPKLSHELPLPHSPLTSASPLRKHTKYRYSI